MAYFTILTTQQLITLLRHGSVRTGGDLAHSVQHALHLLRGHAHPHGQTQQGVLHLVGHVHVAHPAAILDTCAHKQHNSKKDE